MRARSADSDGVSVTLGLCQIGGSHRQARSRFILDHHGLLELVTDHFGDKPACNVGRTARSRRDDESDRARGVGLPVAGSRKGLGGEDNGADAKDRTNAGHDYASFMKKISSVRAVQHSSVLTENAAQFFYRQSTGVIEALLGAKRCGGTRGLASGHDRTHYARRPVALARS